MATRRSLLVAILAAGLLITSGWSRGQDAPGAGFLLERALAGPQRGAANRARDTWRHPLETLLFFGLKPDQTVVEISPGGGWHTEILAPVLRERGKLYAIEVAREENSAEAQRLRAAYREKLARDPAVYDRVGLDAPPPASADLVLTFRNIHNWIQAGELDTDLRLFFQALKPGGVLGVEEHRAAPGTALERIIATGYVPEAYVIERAQAAGFRLDARAEINANPRDDRDHPNGVWSLPPTLRGGAVDRERYLAIGESDRMTLRFVKP
jgi:predicted methyltransferase